MAITLTTVDVQGKERLQLDSPYHPNLPDKAKALGGKWSPVNKTWHFDPRDTDAVRVLCREVYGVDPLAPPEETVTLEVKLSDRYNPEAIVTTGDQLYLAGRRVLSRPSRDYRVQLGAGVVLLSGGFPSSGGSMRYPQIKPNDGTIILVRDVPASVARELAQKHTGAISIVSEPTSTSAVPSIIDQILALAAQLPTDKRADVAKKITSMRY